MQERINSILSQEGYTQIRLNTRGIYLYLLPSEEPTTSVIVCLDETEGDRFTREQFRNISEQIRDFLRQREYHHTRFLYLLITEDDRSVGRLFRPQDHYWRILPSQEIVMIYENTDPCFSPLAGKLENLFSCPAPNQKKRDISYVTWALIAVNVLIFLAMDLFSSHPDTWIEWGDLSYYLVIYQHEFYRMISSMFLHLGSDHLFNNMISLGVIGTYLEQQLGHARFCILYFSSGILAGCTSMVYNMIQNDPTASAGASGAIFGAIGGLVFVVWHMHRNQRSYDLRRVLFMAALSLYTGFASQSVDNAAHVGGFVSGFLIAGLLLLTLNRKGRKSI